MPISETSTDILRKFVLLTMFESGKSWGNFGFVFITVFHQTSKRGQILTKTVFLPKVSHILLNYAFLLFWGLFGKIHRELFFLDIKVTIPETSTEILRKFVFLTMFERGKSWGNFGFVFITVFHQTSKRGQILTKTVFLPKVSHVLLNYAFLLFWCLFGKIHRELFFLDIKVAIS